MDNEESAWPRKPRQRERPKINLQNKLLSSALLGVKREYKVKETTSVENSVGQGSTLQDGVKGQPDESPRLKDCRNVSEKGFRLQNNTENLSNEDSRLQDRGNLSEKREALKTVIHQKENSKLFRGSSDKSDKKYKCDIRNTDSNKREINFMPKQHDFDLKNKQIKHSHTDKLNCSDDSENQTQQDCIEFKEIKHNREILNAEEKNFKITLKNDVAKPLPVSKTTVNLVASNIIFDKLKDISYSNLECTLLSSSDYIPPPMICKPNEGTYSDNFKFSSSTLVENGYSLQKGNLDAVSEDESYFSLPDSEQLEAITNFINNIVKEKYVPNAEADRIVRDINVLFRYEFDGHTVDLYGSYASDLAISTSDINLALVSNSSIRKPFMFEVYKMLSKDLKKYYVYPYEEGLTTYECKISFSHPDTGVKCELVYLGKHKSNFYNMGKFLRRIYSFDKRVKTLIIAAKIWSESLCINEVEDGKLHPIGYTLLMVHFLQHCDNPLLPNFPCDRAEIEKLPNNNLSVGELWLAFLKYYSLMFNWVQDVVTLNSEECVTKKSKGWESYWLAIEDPFNEKNNAASTVINSDIAEYIKACFKSSYDYFCNPMDNTPDSSNIDDESKGESNLKWHFSFQDCIAEQEVIFCEDCDELMDTCQECSKKKVCVLPVFTVPKMTDGFLEIVKKSLYSIYEKYMLTEEEISERKKFVKELEKKVRRIYPDAELHLFGSCANGFGFKNSDLDICMTFKSQKVNSASVLKDVRFLLRKDEGFDRAFAIYRAQIPIVKFHYEPKGWCGDISLGNTLAIYNSNLLHTYSLVDERCKILGCALKLLAKKALIAEVTEKALSSYSYVNMVIYFLQQIEPPVLPVLQDNVLRNNNYDINSIVQSDCASYNVWFCNDLEYIRTVFKAENKTPVEQLWLELLDFYCAFESNKFISIRQKEPLYISENKRSARLFNIQDPFIETKNLGCVVAANKAKETINILNRARQRFRTPIKELPSCVKDFEDYFFSTQSLTGTIRKEALCDLCGKFGHERKECKQFCFPIPRFNNRQYPKRNTYKNHVQRSANPMNRRPYKNYLPKPMYKSNSFHAS